MPQPEIPGGYILLARKLISSGIMQKPPEYLKVFVYLLLKANHSNGEGLKRGQGYVSIPELIENTAYKVGYRKEKTSKKKIWNILEWLRNPYEGNYEGTTKETMIETTKVTHGVVYTISNYEHYQNPKNYEGNDDGNDEGTTKELRRRRQGNNKYKNDKELKELKNEELNTNTELKNENEIENSDNNKIELLNQGVFPEYLSYVVWNEFVLMRKNVLKSPLTPFGEKLVLAKAERFHNEGYDVNELFELAIVGNWKSIFVPDKLKKGAKSELTDSQRALLKSFSRAD